jgi:putative flavoprotein involved in K+ transport
MTDSTANQSVFEVVNSSNIEFSNWLKNLEIRLILEDLNEVKELFQDDCYWRDLVSFTWNLKTMEGKGEIESMLRDTLPVIKPNQWKTEGDASQNHGIIEGWFTFETSVGKGKGHLRLKQGYKKN